MRYFTFFATHPPRNAATSRLFFSSIIMCPLPWTPTSARRTKVFLTPACVRNFEVQPGYYVVGRNKRSALRRIQVIQRNAKEYRMMRYFTFFATHPPRNAATSRLFFSSIIMCPLPLMPTSARRKKVFLTPACVRNFEVQWS